MTEPVVLNEPVDESVVLAELADGILTITLNRPDAMNALSTAMAKELIRVAARASQDDVRAVVITGSGRGFCAGADLREKRTGDVSAEGLNVTYHPAVMGLVTLEKPVIAALNGPVVGAGLALALAADARIAAPSASFVPAFASIGLVPDSGVGYLAGRVMGESQALRWLASGAKLSAQDALARGLVESISDEPLADATALARQLAETPGRAYGLTKRIMWVEGRRRLIEYFSLEEELQRLAIADPARALARERRLTRLGSDNNTSKEA